MLHRRKLFIAILVGLFGIWGSAFAVDGEYKTPSQEDNVKMLDSAIEHAEAALAAYQAGDWKGGAVHAKESSKILGEINSETWAGPLEGAKAKVRVSGIKAKKGSHEQALSMLTEALGTLKGLYSHSNKTH